MAASPGPGAGPIALDGRGAERGAATLIEGARIAAADGIALRVFGDPAELGPLDSLDGVEVIEAPDQIGNSEEPTRAVRSKPGASIVMAAADVAAGRSVALVSAGATGATMTASLFALRRIRGVSRPALAVQLPVPGGDPVLLLDAGASVEVRAQHLVQSALLGSAFASAVLGIERPRVALLSVGEESSKGTPEVVEAHERLAATAGIGFTGNVEGRDLLTGVADVVVTDGFTGNVTLKTIEGTARAVAGAVGDAARSNPLSALGGLMLRPALGRLRSRMDPDSTGGAILLGLRGVAIVGHGSSGPAGIANAVRLAERSVAERAIERTGELLSAAGATRAAMRRDRQDATGESEADEEAR